MAALRREHVEVPGGVVESGRMEYSVKTDAEFDSIEALEGLVIRHQDGAPIHLRDVARVVDGQQDVDMIARYNGELDAPRYLLIAIGLEVEEMARAGFGARCCGGGGGSPVTDVPGERRIPDMRMDDARATGASTLAVACPNCMVMLEGVVEPRPAVADVAELLAEALEERP